MVSVSWRPYFNAIVDTIRRVEVLSGGLVIDRVHPEFVMIYSFQRRPFGPVEENLHDP
jgi:hypothetical protein